MKKLLLLLCLLSAGVSAQKCPGTETEHDDFENEDITRSKPTGFYNFQTIFLTRFVKKDGTKKFLISFEAPSEVISLQPQTLEVIFEDDSKYSFEGFYQSNAEVASTSTSAFYRYRATVFPTQKDIEQITQKAIKKFRINGIADRSVKPIESKYIVKTSKCLFQ